MIINLHIFNDFTAIHTTEGSFTMDGGVAHTANFTRFQDNLFDSLNARRSKQSAREIRKPLQEVLPDDSPHWEFWKSAIKYLENMRYRTIDNVNPPRANDTRRRFIRSLKLLPGLWDSVKEKGFPYLKIGYVNPDPLENFFGRLKAGGVCNVSPSCKQAEEQLKAIMVSDLSGKNSIGANCLDDEGTTLAKLNTLATENTNTESSGLRCYEFDEVAHTVNNNKRKWSAVTIAKHVVSAGHFAQIVLSSIKEINGCQLCFDALLSDKRNNDNVQILKVAHVKSTGSIADADYFERGFSRGVKLIEEKLSSIGFNAKLRTELSNALKPLDFEWIKCSEHRSLIKSSFQHNLVLHYINNWTIHLNQVLTGQK